MTKRRIKELHDYKWFPDVWRRGMTDFLSFFATYFFQYEPIFPLILKIVRSSGVTTFRDFCSGGSGYLLSLLRFFKKKGIDEPKIELTDKYPNIDAFRLISKKSNGTISYNSSSVDVLLPQSKNNEIRLMFSAMHHFSQKELEDILNSAVKDNCPIGLFDYASWDPIRSIFLLIFLVPHILIIMPFTRPFSWGKMFWTYIVPAIPLALLVDAIISRWNAYSPRELGIVIKNLEADNYEWTIGTKPNFFWTGKVVYLIGCPGFSAENKVNDKPGNRQ